LLYETERPFQNGKGGMTFIEVTDLRPDADRFQQPPTANAKDQFLFEPQFGTASVKLTCDATMSWEVRCVVAVKQVQFHAADLHLPGAQPNGVARQPHFQA